MFLDNKVFQHWIICPYTQIPSIEVYLCVYAQNFLISISMMPYTCMYVEVFCIPLLDFAIINGGIRFAFVEIFNSFSARMRFNCGYFVVHVPRDWSYLGRKM